MQKGGGIEIPIEIFKDRSLSVFEALTEYLVNSHSLSPRQVAILLNRDPRTIHTVYRRLKDKRQGIHKIPASTSQHSIPISIFLDRNTAILNTITRYLVDRQSLSLSRIARLTSRSPKTIWTAYNRN